MCCKCKACCALGMNFRLNFETLTIRKCTHLTRTHTPIFTPPRDTQTLEILRKFVTASEQFLNYPYTHTS